MTKEQATQKAKEIAIRFLQYWLKDDKRLANSRFDDWASTPEAQSLISELVEVRKETVRKLLEDCFDIDATQVDRDTYINSRLSESPSDGQDWISVEAKPKIVTLCGSTRFAQYFMIKRWELEKSGIITLGINILPDNYFAEGDSHGAEQDGVKEILDELHKRKIDLCDEVFILNVDGYIGDSTCSEIEYAIKIGKPVKYLESLPKPPSQ